MRIRLAVFWILVCAMMPAQQRRIALTIDDLPVAQSGPEACGPARLMPLTKKLLAFFAAEEAPLTAFVITSQCPGLTDEQRRAALDLWLSAGVELGNHTHSHRSLSKTPIEEYERDVLKADKLLREWTGKPVRWFRWPMLHAGATVEVKERLEKFLPANGYREAPVTCDNSDWIFANVFADARRRGDEALAKRVREAYVPYMEATLEHFERLSRELLGREIPQVLLMHANLLNSEASGDLLGMLRGRGYDFVTLEEALEDSAYSAPNTYVATNGVSWLHRWTATSGGKIDWEPDPPKWLMDAYDAIAAR